MLARTLEVQISRLVELGFHDGAGLEAPEFADRAGELHEVFDDHADSQPVLVASASFVGTAKLTEQIDREDGKPETVIHAADLDRYEPIPEIQVPETNFYLLTGFNREPETRNLSPIDARLILAERGRSPITTDEGLAVFAQWPECVWPNDGFSLAGSTRGDKRVPAIWVSKQRPKLGWCYLGAPHTWLATASCEGRRVN
ncbi:MAG: DUF5701 family protein [Solirubrobacterales bacterium]